jgi:hypothetical protein
MNNWGAVGRLVREKIKIKTCSILRLQISFQKIWWQPFSGLVLDFWSRETKQKNRREEKIAAAKSERGKAGVGKRDI